MTALSVRVALALYTVLEKCKISTGDVQFKGNVTTVFVSFDTNVTLCQCLLEPVWPSGKALARLHATHTDLGSSRLRLSLFLKKQQTNKQTNKQKHKKQKTRFLDILCDCKKYVAR